MDTTRHFPFPKQSLAEARRQHSHATDSIYQAVTFKDFCEPCELKVLDDLQTILTKKDIL
jgi:hypothetical protein